MTNRFVGKVVIVTGGGSGVGAAALRFADEAAVTELVDEVARTYGRLDVLVNNTGLALQGRAEDTDTTLWRRIMGVELDAVFFASSAALPHLRVNAVAPSLTVTTMTEPFRAMPGVLEGFANRIPMGRAATAD